MHRGHLFHLEGNPAISGAAPALCEIEDGHLVVDAAGTIISCGPFEDVGPLPEGAELVDHEGAYLLPGFVDTHLHFPQVDVRACHGGGALLDWLERCVFPAEAALADPAVARAAASAFCEALAWSGTTTALIFGSQFPEAQTALFEELQARGQRAICGRTVMTRGPAIAQPLLTSLDEALRLCREEVERWHPTVGEEQHALIHAALVPRFALSLDREGLRAFGDLHAELEARGVYFTTHLSENDHGADGARGEIAAVCAEYGIDRYLHVYDGRFLEGGAKGGESFLGPRSVFAHAVHCHDEELARLAETGSAVAHCPISQLFLGSGTMPWRRTVAAGVTLGAGSDVGAGDSFSIPHVLGAAHKVHMSAAPSERVALHPAELLHLGTLGGAQALALEHRIGNFDHGKEADLVVIDPRRDPLLARRLEGEGGRGISALFALLTTSGPAAVAGTWVRGRRVACAWR